MARIVRSKTAPQPAPAPAGVDPQQPLARPKSPRPTGTKAVGYDKIAEWHVGNRVSLAVARSTPLDQFWAFVPAVCSSCKRERKLSLLHVAGNMELRCNDVADCRKVSAATIKARFPVKSDLTDLPGPPIAAATSTGSAPKRKVIIRGSKKPKSMPTPTTAKTVIRRKSQQQ
jgi:hypothetical protein